MSKNKLKENIRKFIENLAKDIHEATGVPVIIIPRDLNNTIFEELKKDKNISKNFSESDLYREVTNFTSTLLVTPVKERAQILSDFMDSLKREKEYTAIILLNGICNLPIGTKLGNLEVIKKYKYNNNDVKEHFERLERERKVYPSKNSWARIKFRTHINFDPSKILFQELELPFAILSFISMLDLDPQNVAGIIFFPDKKIQFLSPYKEYVGWSNYNKKVFNKCLKIISEITLNPSKNRLQKKVLQAIRIFGLSRLSERIEIRFLMTISAMESLLLTNDDRDYIGMKLAQKTAVLLGKNCKDFNERRKLYKHIKKLYRKRSDLIHEGEVKINGSDEEELESYFMNLIMEILELSKVYKKFETKDENKPDDEEGLDDFIEDRLFGKYY